MVVTSLHTCAQVLEKSHIKRGVVVYYCRTYVKAVRGGGVKRGDVCYGVLRAAACVDESDHHALMCVSLEGVTFPPNQVNDSNCVWHGQTVRGGHARTASGPGF